MRQKEVEVGGYYRAKVSGTVVTVLVLSEMVGVNGRTVWKARNMKTGRNLTVRSPQRLRERVEKPAPRLSQ